MPDSYFHVSKPSGTTYHRVGFQGKQSFDDPSILYDDPSVFYDSINNNAYGIVAKPTGGAMIGAGYATGLLIPFTYSQDILVGDPNSHVAKPTN